MIDAAFAQRRKTLRSALAGWAGSAAAAEAALRAPDRPVRPRRDARRRGVRPDRRAPRAVARPAPRHGGARPLSAAGQQRLRSTTVSARPPRSASTVRTAAAAALTPHTT